MQTPTIGNNLTALTSCDKHDCIWVRVKNICIELTLGSETEQHFLLHTAFKYYSFITFKKIYIPNVSKWIFWKFKISSGYVLLLETDIYLHIFAQKSRHIFHRKVAGGKT